VPANRNKCGIKTIGLDKTTPLYLSSLAPCKRSQISKQGATIARAHLTKSRSKVTQTNATSTLQTEECGRLGLGGLAHYETAPCLIQLLGVSRKETRCGDQAGF
jgi:hypothetical protein